MSRILTFISVCVIITPLLSNVVDSSTPLWWITLWWIALFYIAWKVSDKIE